MRLLIGYPDPKDELAVLRRHMDPVQPVQRVLEPREILALQELVHGVHVENELLEYIVRLSQFTRQHTRVYLGASPRASLALVQASRARALMSGRAFVIPDDIKLLAVPVLAHRLVLTPEAEMEGVARESVVQNALEQVPHRWEAVR